MGWWWGYGLGGDKCPPQNTLACCSGTIVLPYMANHGFQHFQHDNAKPHAARVTNAFLKQQAFNVMPWPSLSPDLNPVEHPWDELGRRVRARPVQQTNVAQLEDALQQKWQGIPQQFIMRLIIPCIGDTGL